MEIFKMIHLHSAALFVRRLDRLSHRLELLDAVNAAIERDRARRKQPELVAELRERFDVLTPPEREVLLLAMARSQNKQIAYQLKLSENTIKVPRWQVCERCERDLWSSWSVWRGSSKFPVMGPKGFNGLVGGSIAQKRGTPD
jgi:hypothetical protein